MPTEMVRCPQCECGRVLAPAGPGEPAACEACGARYPIVDGVLDLLPDGEGRRSILQLLMESDLVVRVYEGRLWRRSVLARLVTGMDFETEKALVLAAVAPAADARVLDVACGSGIYTRPLARRARAGLVYGLDLSWPMLRAAQRRCRAEGLTNVRLVHGTALALPFSDAAFDVATCCGALHLFPDPLRVLSEVARVLRPGGRFACAVARRKGSRTQTLANQLGRAWTGVSAFVREELEADLERAGFGEVASLARTSRWMVVRAERPAA